MNIETREASAENIDDLIEIQKEDGFPHAYFLTKDRLDALMRRGESFFIAYAGDEPVGMASVDLEIRAKLHFLSVKKTYWGKRVGSALLQALLGAAKSRDCRVAYMYVEANSPLEQFLAKKGFAKVGVYHGRYGKGKDAHILEAKL